MTKTINQPILNPTKTPPSGWGLLFPVLFTQLLTMDNLPLRGKLSDDQLEIISMPGFCIKKAGFWRLGILNSCAENPDANIEFLEGDFGLLARND